jgi:hypothetical protein
VNVRLRIIYTVLNLDELIIALPLEFESAIFIFCKKLIAL